MKARFSVRILLALLVSATLSTAAHAQATRTWVSGVGDDVNPCSRTAPCKTFAGAISKTATNGEINVLDAGAFGVVTITKSISIVNNGFQAGVLGAGTNAIIINAPTTARVVLRGLDIEGIGTGLAGIKVLAAGSVHIENCTINGFTQVGIDFVPTAAAASTSQLYVTDTIIRNNQGASSGGIRVKPGANVTAIGSIKNVQLQNNQFGLRVEDNSRIASVDTVASGNAGSGFIAVSNAAAVSLNLDRCTAVGNAFGIKADNPAANVRFGNCMIAGNGTGISTSLGGHTTTFTGSNSNADPGTATDSIPRQ
jgi:hypothetical protein